MVMWPEEGSGFEASSFSPAGQLQQEATMIDNVERDPAGVWSAIRGSWGTRIILGGFAVIVVVAALNALLHYV